jgi:hypothetical protein
LQPFILGCVRLLVEHASTAIPWMNGRRDDDATPAELASPARAPGLVQRRAPGGAHRRGGGGRHSLTYPFCSQGTLRMLAAITQAEVIRKMLRHLKRAADPSPIAPARARQAPCDWVASAQPSRVHSGATCAQRRDVSPRCAVAIPFEISPLQPSYVARPEAVPLGAAEALPYPILRRLSSASESGAAPCATWLGAAAVAPRAPQRAMRMAWPLTRDAGGDAEGR